MHHRTSRALALAAALVVGALGCQAGGRAPGQACTTTADCRTDLQCEASTCRPPPSCGDGRCSGGESAATCCIDCPCAEDGQCNATTRTCRPWPRAVCGNGRCEAGESQATCCADCGCAAGATCRAGTCGAVGTALEWTISNRCFNGHDVQFRFFSESRPVSWPAGGLVFVMAQGQTVVQALACNPGEKICFGADQPSTGFLWGAGIDNTLACADCCRTCANASVSYGPLLCN